MSLPATIPEALLATAERGSGEFVFHLEDGVARFSCAELAERAQGGARRLVARGVVPGDPVGIFGPNRPQWVVWAFSTWLAGAVLVPVQVPLRIRDPDAIREQVDRLVRAARCKIVLADPRLAGLLPQGVAIAWEEAGEESGEAPSGPRADSPAVIQFTSGSTSAPKGALLEHSAVMAQMDMLESGVTYGDGTPRVTASWTPFFHDLGLVANLIVPGVWGTYSHHLPTELFARDPAAWLRLIETARATLTVGPSSAFGSALRAAQRGRERPDLSSLEAAYFAAEGADPEVARRLAERAQEFSLSVDALGSTYGLAEAVMAVSYSRAGSGMLFDRVSLDDLARDGVAAPRESGATRLMIGCGRPRMEVRIVGPEGDLPERHVGEILVRGGSLMKRYIGDRARDPFSNGWLRTGDMGYLAENEIFVTGRAKDMIVVAGNNYYPEDFEWAAARAGGVRPGRCIAFAQPDDEKVVVLVEASDGGGQDSLRRAVAGKVMGAIGVSPSDVVVLPPGTVEKTTSGKLRRAAMREAYANGTLDTGVR